MYNHVIRTNIFIDSDYTYTFHVQSKQEDIYGNLVVFLQPASEEDELYAQMKACGIRNIPADLIK